MKFKKRLLVFGIVLLLLPAGMAYSNSITIPNTLADLIALGSEGYQVQDKLFYDFFYSSSASGGADPVPASGVGVTPLDIPLNPGWLFQAPWSVGQGQTMDSLIQYSVKVLDGGPPITDISAKMEGYGHFSQGIVVVAETGPVNLLLSDDSSGTVSYQEAFLEQPTFGPITVYKDISVNGNDGLATVSAVYNQFSETPVPEPATMLLLGSGLVGMAPLIRRKFKKDA